MKRRALAKRSRASAAGDRPRESDAESFYSEP
jgi:hypothetical protein